MPREGCEPGLSSSLLSTARSGALAVGVARPASPARTKPTSTPAPEPRQKAARGPVRGRGQLLSYGSRTAKAWREAGRDSPAPRRARRRWPPRACALARPCAPSWRRDHKASAAIWWRRPGSCGAERGGRVRGGRPLTGAPEAQAAKHIKEAPRLCPLARLRFPRQKGMAGIPKEAVWCSGRRLDSDART